MHILLFRLSLLQRPQRCSEVSPPAPSQRFLEPRRPAMWLYRATMHILLPRLWLLQRPQRCSEVSPAARSQRKLEPRRPSMSLPVRRPPVAVTSSRPGAPGPSQGPAAVAAFAFYKRRCESCVASRDTSSRYG